MRIVFFFNAQNHQLLHGLPTAVRLAAKSEARVIIASPGAWQLEYARFAAARLGDAAIEYYKIGSSLLSIAQTIAGGRNPPKLLTMVTAARWLNESDAIAVPERTSIFLKRLGVTRPRFIHLDHGAGDRAGKSVV